MRYDAQKVSLLAVVGLLVQGCATRIGDFTVISTQNVNFAAIDAKTASTAPVVEGEDIKFFSIPNLEEAIDDALRKGNGNVMIDAVLYTYSGFCCSGYKVKGRVINAR